MEVFLRPFTSIFHIRQAIHFPDARIASLIAWAYQNRLSLEHSAICSGKRKSLQIFAHGFLSLTACSIRQERSGCPKGRERTVIQPTTHKKRPLSPGHMSNIDSALAQVEEITAEMRRHANSYGQRSIALANRPWSIVHKNTGWIPASVWDQSLLTW